MKKRIHYVEYGVCFGRSWQRDGMTVTNTPEEVTCRNCRWIIVNSPHFKIALRTRLRKLWFK